MNQRNDQDEPSNLLRELENLQRVLDDAASDQVDHSRDIPTLDPVDDIPLLDELFSDNDIPVLKAVTNKPAAVPLRPVAPLSPATPMSTDQQSANKADAGKPDTAAKAPRPVLRAQPLPDVVIQRPQGDMPARPAQVSAATQVGTETRVAETEATPSASSTATPAADNAAAPARVSVNPFLPQAILDRLTQEREAAQHSAQEAHRTMQRVMEQKQARASEQAVQQHMQQLTPLQKEHLIDQLVAEMLPQLTERLREKLREKLNH
jgi:hypothetical protein